MKCNAMYVWMDVDGLLSYVKTFKRFALFINGWNDRHVQFQNV